MGGVSRYFSKVSGSGVDSTLLTKTVCFDENATMTNLLSTHRKQGLCSSDPPPPQKDENDENGGCHPGKRMLNKKKLP